MDWAIFLVTSDIDACLTKSSVARRRRSLTAAADKYAAKASLVSGASHGYNTMEQSESMASSYGRQAPCAGRYIQYFGRWHLTRADPARTVTASAALGNLSFEPPGQSVHSPSLSL